MGGGQESDRVVTLKDGRTRRVWSKQDRLRIVEETLKPGASVALVARAHDVNANQVFKWRKQYHEGQLDVAPTASTLVPVKISDSVPMGGSADARPRGKTRRYGIIDIDLGHARVRIEGAADPDCVRAALERLIR